MSEEILHLEVYKLLFRHRNLIGWFTGAMTVIAVVITMPFITTPLYKAEAVISPAGTNSAKIFIEHDPKFGDAREIDDQTQILQSAMVRDSMIKKFNLAKRYKVDLKAPAGIFDLYKKYEARVSVNRTRYNAISVRVFDADAKTAASMANAMVTIGDHVKNAIIKNNFREVFKSIEKDFFEKGRVLDEKANEVNRSLKQNLVSGSLIRNKGQVLQLKEQIDLKTVTQELVLSGKSADHLLMLQGYDRLLQAYLDLQGNYQQAVINASSDVPSSYIISPAEMINKKAYPPRLWIVIIAAGTSFFLACAFIIGSQRISTLLKKIKS